MRDDDFLPKPEQRPIITTDQIKQLTRRGFDIGRGYPELGTTLGRLAPMLGVVEHLFKGELGGKKIIDLGAGSGPISGHEDNLVDYTPLLANVLQKQGAEVLAVDQYIYPDKDYAFTPQQLDLAHWQRTDLSPAWQSSDLIVSTSFIGEPTSKAGIDNIEFFKKLADVAKLQVHYIIDNDQLSVRHLNSQALEAAGFRVLYNFVDTHGEIDYARVQPVIILEKVG